MNVILLEKVGKLGAVGDTASVKAGYARNFLFPTGKAIPATKTNLDNFETRRAQLLAAHNEKVAVAQVRAEKLKGLRVTMAVNAGEEGKLFGSIGVRDIADAITATGTDVEKSEVRLPEGPLRVVGEYEIELQLHSDVTVHINLAVVAE